MINGGGGRGLGAAVQHLEMELAAVGAFALLMALFA